MALAKEKLELATFAGGCFWCMVKPFDKMPGIQAVISGYTGGTLENPTYEQVCTGMTGHTEAVQITFDPSMISYTRLLELYWMQIDPTDPGGQFFDRGESYRPAIFYHSNEQKALAEQSKQNLEQSGKFSKPIAVSIEPAQTFYEAEDYHQQYYRKNPERYTAYQRGSGREQFIQRYWGDLNEKK